VLALGLQELGAQGSLACLFQSFQQLRATHAALEDNYLQAYRGQHLAPQHVGPKRMPGDADPCRYVLERQAREDRWARSLGSLGCQEGGISSSIDTQGEQREPSPSGFMSKWWVTIRTPWS
jgi:hypothetical protein